MLHTGTYIQISSYYGINVESLQLSTGGTEPKVKICFVLLCGRVDEYVARGVRKSYNGEGTSQISSTTLSQDLEPENIALSYDDKLAYIPLQVITIRAARFSPSELLA